jgi:Sec7-like guanine-nucleotide exchange factor
MLGETQLIERIMVDFGYEYWEQNKETTMGAMDKDSIFGYSFAIILLNTDKHNQQMKDSERMTLPQFKNNVKMMLDGAECPSDVEMDLIYDSIAKTQIIALKSVDLVGETKISQELWDFVHYNKQKRKDILSQILPASTLQIYLDNKSYLMRWASSKIAKEVQSIFHENLMFLVLDNTGNFEVVMASFDNLVQNVESADSIRRLEKFYEDFYESFGLDRIGDGGEEFTIVKGEGENGEF